MLVELVEEPPVLRATFAMDRSHKIRVDLEISLIGDGNEPSSGVTEIRRILDKSRYSLAAPDLCQECYWQDVLSLINRCHKQARSVSAHVVTRIRIEETRSNCLHPEDQAADFMINREELIS